MESVYTAYLSVIRRSCCPSSGTDIVILPEEAKALADLSREHRTAPFLLPFLHRFRFCSCRFSFPVS